MSIQDTITIIKEQITDGEIERCIMAHKAGISPQLIAFDSGFMSFMVLRGTKSNSAG